MKKEIWKEVPDTNYLVSSFGNIKRKDGGGNMFQCKNWHGYMQTNLRIDGKRITKKIHRLVCSAFYGNIDGMDINHIDGDKTNNKLNNLEVCTHGENIIHAVKTGLIKSGKDDYRSCKVNMCGSDGCVLGVYHSINEASKITGIHKGSISKVVKGNRKLAGGYRWEYA